MTSTISQYSSLPKNCLKYEGIGVHVKTNCFTCKDGTVVASCDAIGDATGAVAVGFEALNDGSRLALSVTVAEAVFCGKGLTVGDGTGVCVGVTVGYGVAVLTIGVFCSVDVISCDPMGDGLAVCACNVVKDDAVTLGDAVMHAVTVLVGDTVVGRILCKIIVG